MQVAATGHAKVTIEAQAMQSWKATGQNKMLKLVSLIAALLAAAVPSATHAQSWDAKPLGKKPEAPAPKPKDRAGGMKACPEYGAGFYRLAGSDTCVRIGGGVSTDVGASGVMR